MTPTGASASGTKPCKMCGEPIKKFARVCPHCMSHQDWREHLGFSQSVLALLVALIAVGTVFIPVLQQALVPDNSNLEFSFQAIEAKAYGPLKGADVTVLATNKGVRPGTIFRVYLNDGPTLLTSSSSIVGTLDGSSPLPGVLIEPGTSKLVTAFFKEFPKSGKPFVIVSTRDFEGHVIAVTIPFPD